MRAWELGAFGLDGLRLVERPDPTPGPGEALVELTAWSVNFRDLSIVLGTYNPKQSLPLVPLSDGAGRVVAVGSGVSWPRVGDRVVTLFFRNWTGGRPTRERLKSAAASPQPGVLCERMSFHPDALAPAPAHLSDAQAATLPCAALTAWSALELAGTTSGDTVVTQGSGGVSVFALQLAKLRSARVISTSKSDAKRARLEALGADTTLSYVAEPAWGSVVKRKLTDGGADHVVEVGGAGTVQQSIEAVRPDGVVSVIGVLAGGAGPVSLVPVLMQNIRLQGVIVGSRDSFVAMSRAMEVSKLAPVVDVELGFGELREALARMSSGEHFGKIVLRA
ncbi:MAG: NAD(P)-dependent alcohol dehydrogenase [Deltaproteobacteria bacterium]|nr:NAD(P)-dependent alcohol dehydrogenase [Deltaproteobacteria bacterium]